MIKVNSFFFLFILKRKKLSFLKRRNHHRHHEIIRLHHSLTSQCLEIYGFFIIVCAVEERYEERIHEKEKANKKKTNRVEKEGVVKFYISSFTVVYSMFFSSIFHKDWEREKEKILYCFHSLWTWLDRIINIFLLLNKYKNDIFSVKEATFSPSSIMPSFSHE